MAATPKYGTMHFLGKSTGQMYSIDIYISDVAAAAVRFDGGAGAGAGSETFITFNEPVLLKDFSMITGTADTEKIRLTANNSPLPHILRYSVHLNTLATRPELNIPFRAGTRISGIQISD
jgi:hypothetical protein